LSNNVDLEYTTIGLGADLEITKSDFPDPVAPGGLLTYTLNVVNNGPNIAPIVSLVDTLPDEVTFVSSQPGGPICSEQWNRYVWNMDTGSNGDDHSGYYCPGGSHGSSSHAE
jgi:uncharacterized repeat protein (TIGR01451 family)